jgi:hypothetical protein
VSVCVAEKIASGDIASRSTELPATTIATAPAAGMYRVNVAITLSDGNDFVMPSLTFTSSAGEQTTAMGGQFGALSSGQPSVGGSFVLESVADADIQLSTAFDVDSVTYAVSYSVEAL